MHIFAIPVYQKHINHIPAICHHHGIEDLVLSPGSRSAPLTLAFARYGKFRVRISIDERSAAFVALGIAQQTKKPVVLLCTSGSAALNYFPAVAEAFFQKIPLLILTADRPPELIGLQDGQTIFQQQMFGKHVKAFYQLPDHYTTDEEPGKSIHAAIHDCLYPESGPVHINVPLREPLYEKEAFAYPEIEIQNPTGPHTECDFTELGRLLAQSKKVMLISAALPYQEDLQHKMKALIENRELVFLPDVCSNLRTENSMTHYDALLSMGNDELKKALQPDLLISMGDNHISKNLKIFLREYKPLQHMHVSMADEAPDTFGSLNLHLKASPDELLIYLEDADMEASSFYKLWSAGNEKAAAQQNEFLEQSRFGEFTAINRILENLETPSVLQIANSMPVRYVNYLAANIGLRVYCNRGTSGIDGCISTAVGAALSTEDPVVLITGDLAFLYDEHGLWNDFVPPNLKIIVINNGGGGIFRLIDGPSMLPERDTYFVTPTKRSIREVARHYGLHYFKAANAYSLEGIIAQLYHPSDRALVAEIVTEPETDMAVFAAFKQLALSGKA